jgi:hypothetical protein
MAWHLPSGRHDKLQRRGAARRDQTKKFAGRNKKVGSHAVQKRRQNGKAASVSCIPALLSHGLVRPASGQAAAAPGPCLAGTCKSHSHRPGEVLALCDTPACLQTSGSTGPGAPSEPWNPPWNPGSRPRHCRAGHPSCWRAVLLLPHPMRHRAAGAVHRVAHLSVQAACKAPQAPCLRRRRLQHSLPCSPPTEAPSEHGLPNSIVEAAGDELPLLLTYVHLVPVGGPVGRPNLHGCREASRREGGSGA